jgi:peptidoglycan/LPS O-acetylase OafA/YrhL
LLPVASHYGASLCPEPYWVCFSLAGNLQYFLVGFLLADLYLAGFPALDVRNFKWDLLFLLAGVGVVLFRHSLWLEYVLPVIILICCLAAFHGTIAFRILGNSWVTTIGGMCYTLYMYHWLLISLLVRVTGRWRTHILWLDLLIQFIVMSAIIIGLCAVLFVLFERPFMRRNWPSACWSWLRPAKKTPNVQDNLPPV